MPTEFGKIVVYLDTAVFKLFREIKNVFFGERRQAVGVSI